MTLLVEIEVEIFLLLFVAAHLSCRFEWVLLRATAIVSPALAAFKRIFTPVTTGDTFSGHRVVGVAIAAISCRQAFALFVLVMVSR